MAPSNKAAKLSEPRAHPMVVESTPYPTVAAGEIIVKVAATAVNPMDWYIQLLGEKLFSWLQYPYVGGSDVAGDVVEVGPNVTKVKVGDRVLGLAAGFAPKNGGFQEYVVLEAAVVAPIPAHLPYADAAVLPLGLSTAACGLYQKDFLGLDFPTLNPKPNGKVVLIWAGASSVGTNAIQLAVASGYEVITTSSPPNFGHCKSLGASHVFDYKSSTVVQDVLDVIKGKECVGGYAIQPGSDKPVFEIISKAEGRKFVACAMQVQDPPAGIEAKMVFGSTLKENEVGPAIYDHFLPAALAQKKYQCVPKPVIVGHGLEHIQTAVDKGKSGGASCQKLVVTL
uniref:Hfaza2L n=2 Tax=Hypoxylon fragiforme TaxID=63214 RepID=A0A7G6J4F1_9PEZI|nr:Hfaza2L [Hypoxylon fragiforme]